MRKLLLGALLPLIMLSSCNSEGECELQTGEGTLVVKTRIMTDGVQLIPTRADEVSEFYITIINSANNIVLYHNMKLPADRIIRNIPVGNYDITLTNHAAESFIPAFETPYYKGTRQNVQVTQNSNQDVSIDCIQKNAGVRFIYDNSLQTAGLGDMYPVIKQNNVILEYKGDRKKQIGYFNVGDAAITLTDAKGTSYKIAGAREKILTLGSEQLWEVTLKAGETNSEKDNGSIKMTVNIIAINKPTNTEELVVGDKSKSLFEISMIKTAEGNMFNIKAETLMDEMAFYYMEENLWDKQEMTKDKIQTLGRKLSGVELAAVSSPSGKMYNILSSMKEHTVYRIWVYGSSNGEAQIKYLDVSYFN